MLNRSWKDRKKKENLTDDDFVVFKGVSFSDGGHEVVEKGLGSKAGKAAMESWGKMAENVSRQAASGKLSAGEAGNMLRKIHAGRPEVVQSPLKRLFGKIAKKPKIG
jgi:hypothetical protein